MKRIVTGILAHVDAGKTTLSEALLYTTGNVRQLGRVDHGDAFLDTNTLERQRGITIFTEPAIITTPNLTLTLLDTPGHVDFSAEMERTLAVLDYAILVISGADGIQGHTETLWRLLKRYNVPTFIFINKMDAPAADKTKLLNQLKKRFSDGCIDFTGAHDDNAALADVMEDIAMQSETAMELYLESGTIQDETIREMIADRVLFPCFFGSALKMDGIDEFVAGFERYVREPEYDDRKEQIVHYWEKRSESFLEQRRSELANPIAKRWMKEIEKQIPAGRRLKILDVGCGAGFFSILLAKEGHEVFGIDLTPEMIENAIQLAEEENADCCFQVMDAENPMFADETFDVVISRNLTWTLPNAEHAYGEWMRVLKTGGVLLNFDANYGKEDVADTKGLPEAHAHFKVGNEMLEECERIKSQLPISRKNRPAYDVAVLCENTAGEIRIDTSLGKRIYLEKDEFYNPAPMFSICAVKQ